MESRGMPTSRTSMLRMERKPPMVPPPPTSTLGVWVCQAMWLASRTWRTRAVNSELGSDLKSRDLKAVRKSVSGLVKLVYPNGELSMEELVECPLKYNPVSQRGPVWLEQPGEILGLL